MEKILLSSVVGIVTYFVLSAGVQFSDAKISSLQLKGGGENEPIPPTSCDIFPECFMISENAKIIFERLINNKKCGTVEYDDLAALYSKMFCFEIALGNNPNAPDHIEVEKVKQLLKNFDETEKYGVKLVINKDKVTTYPKASTFIDSFVTDIDDKVKPLLSALGVSSESFELHAEIIKRHRDNLHKLYNNLNI